MKSAYWITPLRFVIFGLVAGTGALRGNVVPASLFCEHAVLQQGMPIPIWGTADENDNGTVTLAGQTASTVAHGGKWSVPLRARPAGGPHVLSISGKNRVEIANVRIGELRS